MSDFTPPSKKEKILIVDDSEMNRCMLEDILENEFEIIQAENGVEAVAALKRDNADISLVMLDMVMPGMDGFDVLSVMNRQHWIDNIPVIIISVENSPNYIEHAYDLGATDYIKRPFDAVAVRRRVINTINLYANQKKLVGIVADQIYEKEKTNSLMINILSHIVEFRNGESGMHVLHIHTITEALLNRYVARHSEVNMSHGDISLISLASALHDIGKISIPEEILNKPGRLTNEEFAVMKTHSRIGAEMLGSLPYQDEPLLKTAYEICRWHHERFDGRGYPDGLAGDKIPLSAQVVAVADVYDALTSERVYKKAFSHEKAMEMILGGECGAFNPEVLECLKDISAYLREELKFATDKKRSRREVQDITEQMLRYNELKVSEQTLGLLENERIKYQFLSSISREIQFDYIAEPPMLSISEWGARKLGLQENIIEPKSNEKFLSVIPIGFINELASRLRASTPEKPIVECECEIKVDSSFRQYKIICRSMWTYEDDCSRYVGAVGKAIEAHIDNDIDSEYMSAHDQITGLYNAHYARQIISDMLAENNGKKYALGVIALEHFRSAGGDKLTQTFRDGVLKFISKKISSVSGREDIVARLDGNTFLVFVSYENDPSEKLRCILDPITKKYDGFSVSAYMGAASTEYTERSCSSLYTDALRALQLLSNKDSGQYLMYGEKIMPNGYEE